jgi:hypothetical protein
MDFELAKRLKDAGFAQGGNGKWVGPPETIVWRSGDRAYVPTLEELIEACGEDFKSLIYSRLSKNWECCNAGYARSYFGSTPTEAVARLWLALNERSAS